MPRTPRRTSSNPGNRHGRDPPFPVRASPTAAHPRNRPPGPQICLQRTQGVRVMVLTPNRQKSDGHTRMIDPSSKAWCRARNKECPFATPSACRAQIAFDLAGPRVGLRSRHSALWAVAGSGVDLQANRHPRPLHFAPAGLELKLVYKNLPPWRLKGGAAAGGSGGQRPQRGSIRRGEAEDRGTSRVPAGEVSGWSGEAGASAHSLSS